MDGPIAVSVCCVDTEGGDGFLLQYSYRIPSDKNLETNIGKTSVGNLS